MKTVNVAIAIYAICLASIFLGANYAHAEEPEEPVPSEFYHDYTPDVQLVLEFDPCDRSDASKGWNAYAIEKSTGRKGIGCWMYSAEETVTIAISIGVNAETGGEEFLDYRLFKSKFTPRYD